MQVVVRGTNKVVARWPPGDDEERDLVAAIAAGVRAKGVGVFRTEAHVVAAVEGVVRDALLSVKRQVKP